LRDKRPGRLWRWGLSIEDFGAMVVESVYTGYGRRRRRKRRVSRVEVKSGVPPGKYSQSAWDSGITAKISIAILTIGAKMLVLNSLK
jgi:hypothetical protein